VVDSLPEGLDVARTVGEDVQDATGGDAVGHEEQVLFRRVIRPVAVLIDHDLRPHPSGQRL
jgi:hypothetical protein